MSRLQQLRDRQREIEEQLQQISRQIELVPDSLPMPTFIRRLNALESESEPLWQELVRIRREIGLYEDILAEVRSGIAC